MYNGLTNKRIRKFLKKTKKCPWCGKRDPYFGFKDDNKICVNCGNCNHDGKAKRTPKKAVKSWNKER